MDEWCATQLERRAKALKDTKHLIYRGNGSEESRQASCCIAIKDMMIRAGLDTEPDLRPSSLVAWAGVKIHDETNSIEQVALRLGIRSLDTAARFINYDWK